MKKKMLVMIVAFGAVVGLLSMTNVVFARGLLSDCGPHPTWACVKCVYHDTCTPPVLVVK